MLRLGWYFLQAFLEKPFCEQLLTFTLAEKQRSNNFLKVHLTIFSFAFVKDTYIRQTKLKNLLKPDGKKLVPERIKELPGNYDLYWMYIESSVGCFHYMHCIILSSLLSAFAPCWWKLWKLWNFVVVGLGSINKLQ